MMITAPAPLDSRRPARIALLLARVGLAALLLAAGAIKLRDPLQFSVEIANYRLLTALAPHLAIALPAVELLIGTGLLCFRGLWRQAAEVAALVLFIAFAAGVTSAYVRGIDIACGCFGGGGDAISGTTVLRNLGLVVLAAGLLVLDHRATDRQHRAGAPG